MSTTMFLIMMGIATVLGMILGALYVAYLIYKKIVAGKAYIVVESWDGKSKKSIGNPEL